MIFPNPFRFVAAAFWGLWYWINTGHLFAKPRTVQSRRAICTSCAAYDPEWEQCVECTCFVNMKVVVASEACPLGKWGKEWRPLAFLWRLVKRFRKMED